MQIIIKVVSHCGLEEFLNKIKKDYKIINIIGMLLSNGSYAERTYTIIYKKKWWKK